MGVALLKTRGVKTEEMIIPLDNIVCVTVQDRMLTEFGLNRIVIHMSVGTISIEVIHDEDGWADDLDGIKLMGELQTAIAKNIPGDGKSTRIGERIVSRGTKLETQNDIGLVDDGK